MTDPVITRFAEACGATGPLDLRVDLVDGGILAEGTVPMPFSLVGRDDACDVTLTDAEVNPRHAWLQVLGGRVYAVDLGSRTGLGWQGGTIGSGWMEVGTPVRVGPFQVRLRAPVAAKPTALPTNYNPILADPATIRSRPTANLEFRNGKRERDRWSVNRLITLVGRAPECKIHLTADDIASYHCGLVLTPAGLWVVDLSGCGVVVNGERMRVSPLCHAAELWVGRFLIGVQYPGVPPTTAHGRAASLTPPTPLSGISLGSPPAKEQVSDSSPTEDEVPLGVVTETETDAGLPSSHIMADAFRLWGSSNSAEGPVSNPILVSGPTPTPTSTPVQVSPSAPTRPDMPPLLDLLVTPLPPETPAADAVGLLLRQLGDIHAQLFAQYQNSLVLMVQLFSCLRREQLPALQQELARIQELNSELAQLQGEVARRAGEVLPIGPSPSSTRLAQSRVHVPAPATSTPPPLHSTPLHDWVIDRINGLQRERQTRWQSLVGMFSGKTG